MKTTATTGPAPVREAVSVPAAESALRVDRNQRAALASDDALPPAKTIGAALAAAAAIWAMVLLSLALR